MTRGQVQLAVEIETKIAGRQPTAVVRGALGMAAVLEARLQLVAECALRFLFTLEVTAADVEGARQEGATDKEIHDTVLIAAAFCMFNRYVDGLATWQPHDPDVYREIGQHTARLGYVGRDYKKPLEAIASKQGFAGTKVAGS